MVIDTLQFLRKFTPFHLFLQRVGQWQLHRTSVLTVDFASGNCPEETPPTPPRLKLGRQHRAAVMETLPF